MWITKFKMHEMVTGKDVKSRLLQELNRKSLFPSYSQIVLFRAHGDTAADVNVIVDDVAIDKQPNPLEVSFVINSQTEEEGSDEKRCF